MQVAVLTVNFMRPPTVGVEILTVRVCSPATIIGSQVSKYISKTHVAITVSPSYVPVPPLFAGVPLQLTK
jgi:hypothetical protein